MLRRWLAVLKWLAADLLRRKFGPCAPYAAYTAHVISKLLRLDTRSIRFLMYASRASNGRLFTDSVRKSIVMIQERLPRLLAADVAEEIAMRRCVVLRMPERAEPPRWRGILLVSFTQTSAYLCQHYDLKRLTQNFHVVLEPSWAGYCDPNILAWTLVDRPVIVQSSEVGDRNFLRELSANLLPVAFGASDWVDPHAFSPKNAANKIYDSIYVANRGTYKRVHVFLSAIRKILTVRPNFRAALVCHHWGGPADVIEGLIDHYQVRGRFDFLDSVPYSEISTLYSQSKSCVLLSLKEGSNRSLFESMFCDTPVILLSENIGVNKDYINPETGILVSERRLHHAMIEISESWPKYRPREWALRNISPANTTAKLAAVLQALNPQEAISADDLLLKTNRPEVEYMTDDPHIVHSAERTRVALQDYRYN